MRLPGGASSSLVLDAPRFGDRRKLVLKHHAAVRAALSRWEGTEHDFAGDGFFASFVGPARAIHCAHEIAAQVSSLGIETRAAVHIGECEVIDDKPGGIAVTIGARLLGTAGPREVVVSRTVKDLVAGSGLVFDDAGEHELKGVPGSWHLYRATASLSLQKAARGRRSDRYAVLAGSTTSPVGFSAGRT